MAASVSSSSSSSSSTRAHHGGVKRKREGDPVDSTVIKTISLKPSEILTCITLMRTVSPEFARAMFEHATPLFTRLGMPHQVLAGLNRYLPDVSDIAPLTTGDIELDKYTVSNQCFFACNHSLNAAVRIQYCVKRYLPGFSSPIRPSSIVFLSAIPDDAMVTRNANFKSIWRRFIHFFGEAMAAYRDILDDKIAKAVLEHAKDMEEPEAITAATAVAVAPAAVAGGGVDEDEDLKIYPEVIESIRKLFATLGLFAQTKGKKDFFLHMHGDTSIPILHPKQFTLLGSAGNASATANIRNSAMIEFSAMGDDRIMKIHHIVVNATLNWLRGVFKIDSANFPLQEVRYNGLNRTITLVRGYVESEAGFLAAARASTFEAGLGIGVTALKTMLPKMVSDMVTFTSCKATLSIPLSIKFLNEQEDKKQ